MSRPATPKPVDLSSRPHTPSSSLVRPSARRLSQPGTPRHSRPGTPSRVQADPSADWMRHPPNNLGLADPRTQDRASDLLGVAGTEPVKDPPTEAELAKVRELADKLSKKKT
ncbi:hypothetical protein JCM1840_006028 [Sporobolomyces johnsonii]